MDENVKFIKEAVKQMQKDIQGLIRHRFCDDCPQILDMDNRVGGLEKNHEDQKKSRERRWDVTALWVSNFVGWAMAVLGLWLG